MKEDQQSPRVVFFKKTSTIDTVLVILAKDKKRQEQINNIVIKGDIIIDPTN